MRIRFAAAAVACAAVCGLAGCSGGAFSGGLNQAGSSSGVGTAGAALRGLVRGGQQPIAGAHVYLFAANITGYGGNGIAASSSNASVSLLTSGTGRTLDMSGTATNGDYYVTTDGNGSWGITGDYTCTAGQQVYLYALGGDAGAGANGVAGLMAALGACPMAGTFATATPYVVVNEVTTIAAAYAMAGFATDALHVSSSGTPLALTGIANAFANATNLETISTGVALATTSAGNGTVPQTAINTLGNILASCVNSNGAVTGPSNATACYTLFTNALAGGTTGAQPTDTATAAINMAHHSGTNVASLYGLSIPTPPFAPALNAQPNDLSIAVSYTGGGLNSPNGIAIDASGNAWISNYAGNSVTELSNLGAALSGGSGYAGGGMSSPIAIAIDGSGNAWIANEVSANIVNSGNGSVTKLSSMGSVLSGASGYIVGGVNGPYGIAIDGTGDAWVPNGNNSSVTELTNVGSAVSGSGGYTGGGLDNPGAIAIDGAGDAWLSNHSSVTKLSKTGSAISGANGYTGGGLSYENSGMAVDSAGDMWISNGTDITELSSTGSILSGAGGYSGGGMANPSSIAIDGAGNVWIANYIGTFPTLTGISAVELSSSGSVLSGTNGYGYSAVSAFEPNAVNVIAVDGSGDVWLGDNGTSSSVTELIGAAVPVITPVAAGLPVTPTSGGTSNLGTRP